MKKQNVSREEFAHAVEADMELFFRIAYSILQNEQDAEDAVADAVLAGWEKIGRLKELSKLRNWLITIIRNKARTVYRKKKKIILCDEVPETGQREKQDENIWCLVGELREKEQIVIILYYYKGFSVKEIAEILRIPQGTVRSRMSSARKKLKNFIENGG